MCSFTIPPTYAGSDGQAARAVQRFALASLAGELATEAGLTGLDRGEITSLIMAVFEQYVVGAGRFAVSIESEQAKNAILDFINVHGDSRFSNKKEVGGHIVHNRAGWYEDGTDGDGSDYRVFLFHRSGLEEALRGLDKKRAIDALIDTGLLGSRGSVLHRVSSGAVRLYGIKIKKD
jgi:hypothetical protein